MMWPVLLAFCIQLSTNVAVILQKLLDFNTFYDIVKKYCLFTGCVLKYRKKNVINSHYMVHT